MVKTPSNLPPLVRRALRRSMNESSTKKYAEMSSHEKRPPIRVPSLRDYSQPRGGLERRDCECGASIPYTANYCGMCGKDVCAQPVTEIQA